MKHMKLTRAYLEMFKPGNGTAPKHAQSWKNFINRLPRRSDHLPESWAQLKTTDQDGRAEWGARMYYEMRDRMTAAGLPLYSMRIGGSGVPMAAYAPGGGGRQLTAVDRYLTGRRLAEVAALMAAGRDPHEAITRSRLGEMRSRSIMYRNMLR